MTDIKVGDKIKLKSIDPSKCCGSHSGLQLNKIYTVESVEYCYGDKMIGIKFKNFSRYPWLVYASNVELVDKQLYLWD